MRHDIMKQTEFKKKLPVNTVIFTEGDLADCAYIIETGVIGISIQKDGNRLVIAELRDGDLLGEMALIDDQARNATATTLSDVELIIIPKEYIEKKIKQADPTLRFFLQVIMERYRDVHTRLKHVVKHLGNNQDHDDTRNIYNDTKDVVKMLAEEYVQMQERIMAALNSSSTEQENHSRHDQELKYTADILNLDYSLHSAIENREFELYYQPIVDLTSDRIAGCEALIRWHHPKLGFVSPIDFIPVAEENGTIIPIGEWVITEACQALYRFQQVAFQRRSEDNMYMSINLSARQFEGDDLLVKIERILNETPISNKDVKFEITETLLMSNPELAAISLDKLKKLDVSLAIDDFGTGYSSFSYLNRFPIDTLKIDRAFVHTMCENEKSETIVHSLSDLAHSLHMNVIAEGIEIEEERDRLKKFGCDYGQGYYYSKPVTEDVLLTMLAEEVRTENKLKVI